MGEKKNPSPEHQSKQWNIIIDEAVTVLETSKLHPLCKHVYSNKDEATFREWIKNTDLQFKHLDYNPKKALEFFFSMELLEINPQDHLLDAAGGESGYLDALRETKGCLNVYLSDHIYSGLHINSSGLKIVGGDIGCIALPDRSVDKIACHHAFEHFKRGKDIDFIREIGRLLRPGGRACLIPLFLVTAYTECWNIDHDRLFDDKAQLLIDKTASIPGAENDGHFARLYDPAAFQRRILVAAKKSRLIPTIVTCQIDGNDLPDMNKNFGSKLNYPLRALLLDKMDEE